MARIANSIAADPSRERMNLAAGFVLENTDRIGLFIFMMRKHVWPESFYAIELYGCFLYIPLLEIIAFPLMTRFPRWTR
ncbi:hypothetical protein [Agrobacterium bohemicum]|uniref:hypothetical protein n=1 Tax=Agrobacterium bohemicum TaxID=2052828 RepID=UPI00156AC9BB|nr:hypothetical protein [Agrobacterium bohemicum]